MKKFYLLCTLLFAFIFVNAQVKKGSLLIGGQLGYNNTVYKYTPAQPDQKNNTAYTSISAGQAIKDNMVAGLILGYTHGNAKDNYNGTSYTSSTLNGYSAAVFYRRYKNLSKDFYFFGAATAGYSYDKQDITYNNSSDKSTNAGKNITVRLAPGLAYSLCKKLQVELSLPDLFNISYNHGKNTSTTTTTTSHNFNAGTSLNGGLLNNLSMGFQLIL